MKREDVERLTGDIESHGSDDFVQLKHDANSAATGLGQLLDRAERAESALAVANQRISDNALIVEAAREDLTAAYLGGRYDAAKAAQQPETLAQSASRNRVSYTDDGELDEIVTDAGMHLERMSDRGWFLCGYRSDGSSVAVWFRGTVTLVEERSALTAAARPTTDRPATTPRTTRTR